MHGDNPDFVVWNDSVIRVLVPSDASADSMGNGVAGTGPIRVENSTGDMTSSVATLTVDYAFRRRRVLFDRTQKFMVLSAPTTDSLGMYRFRMDSAFSSDTSAAAVFRKAIRDWRCATLVNWTVGKDSAGLSLQVDGVSSVSFAALDPGVLGQTAVNDEFCTDMVTGELFYFSQELDLVFTTAAPFHIDTLSLPGPLENDFYSVVLHELGHGHLLQHRNNPGTMMHYAIVTGTAVRTIDPTIEFAGERVLDSSQVMRPLSCAAPLTPIDAELCDILNHRPKPTSPITHLGLFPNPSADEANLTIQFNKPTKDVEVRIIDEMGHLLFTSSVSTQGLKSVTVAIPTTTLPAGIYPISISTGEHISHRMLTILK